MEFQVLRRLAGCAHLEYFHPIEAQSRRCTSEKARQSLKPVSRSQLPIYEAVHKELPASLR